MSPSHLPRFFAAAIICASCATPTSALAAVETASQGLVRWGEPDLTGLTIEELLEFLNDPAAFPDLLQALLPSGTTTNDGPTLAPTDVNSFSDGYTDETGTFGPGDFAGTVEAHATFGSVGAAADFSITNGAYSLQYAAAGAAFTESFLITDGVGEGTIEFTFNVTGSATGMTDAVVLSFTAAMDLATNPEAPVSVVFEQPGTVGAVTTEAFTFTYGVPFEMSFALSIGIVGGGTDTFDAAGLYANTVTLDHLTLSGGQVGSTGSGTTYNAVSIPAPLAVSALPLAFLLLRRGPRSRRR